jgi:hypothetical protein
MIIWSVLFSAFKPVKTFSYLSSKYRFKSSGKFSFLLLNVSYSSTRATKPKGRNIVSY